jgi:hypothetical protein
MLNQQERDAIDDLFDRIEAAARKNPPREPEAEALIQQRLRDYPPSPYYMAQTILVQEQALRTARERIEELEANQQPSGGGFLGGLFGGDEPARPSRRARGPWDQGADRDVGRGQGGGFLAGAAQTAMGVTGGLLLGSAIAGMLGGDAHAAEYQADQPQEPAVDDTDNGDTDYGGDDDGFDMGGDF